MYITGQTAIFIKDLNGREYPVIAEITRKRRVNGQREISLSLLYTEINKDFIHDIEFGWKVLFDGEWYTITHPGYSTDGDFITVGVTAILSFFVDMNGFYLQDKVENKSNTPANYFTELFNGTPYNFILVDNLAANTFSYEDNQSKTERFLYGIDRFKAEYLIRGNNAYIYSQIGSDKDVILHEDLNINSVKIDVDASGFHTWAKGYGDLPDSNEVDVDPEYQIEVEYRSPLISKYGAIEGPAIKDGNYKSVESLTEAVKNQVENSYKISTEVDAVDLTNNGYPEMILDEGDRVWLYVSSLKLNQQVRVMEVDENFDWEGNRIEVHYTLGNESIASRYKTQQYDTLKDFQDILNGKKKIQTNWLPDAIQRASDIINGNQDSLFRYLPGEIIGINQTNPNGYMRFNTDGLGFSRDGGKTYRNAITYEGIAADAITTGTLNANIVKVSGAISIVRPDEAVAVNNGIMQGDFLIDRATPFYMDPEVSVSNNFFMTRSFSSVTSDALYFKHAGRYLTFVVWARTLQAGCRVDLVNMDPNETVKVNATLGFPFNDVDDSTYQTITIDLGRPTYRNIGIYLKFNSYAGGIPTYMRYTIKTISG
ncbi:phage tail protein [Cytobacillus horneckiae]|uniref:phage tail protein n=1 Tax=Cytobacillus horneckiae TaxID=549687 RepID=UPI00203C075A|nr:phage tail protein [Cytobacillus horneckiae]MCM3180249.1 phage tail protein [Cytobacillus horneckiae]